MVSIRSVRSAVSVLVVILLLAGCGGPAAAAIVLAGGMHASNPLADTPVDRYLLLLMVDPARPKEIAAFAVICEGMRLSGADGLMGTSVPIQGNGFQIDNADITLDAHVVDSGVITGTIAAHSQKALECGVPRNDAWQAGCGLDTGVTGLWIDGKEVAKALLAPCSAGAPTPEPKQ